MQPAEVRFHKSSLLLALRGYCSAVRDMELTVLMPSLLRDVPSDDLWDAEAEEEESCKDLYANYHMLKAIRNAMESGLVLPDDHKPNDNPESLLDPESLFHFHLRGLFSVMSELTEKTRSLTDKYMDIIGIPN